VIGSGKTERPAKLLIEEHAIATSATIVKTDRELRPIKRQEWASCARPPTSVQSLLNEIPARQDSGNELVPEIHIPGNSR
jgi:hypothetical protein